MKRGRGRPLVVTPEIRSMVVAYLEMGYSQRDAAKKFSVSTASVNHIAQNKTQYRKPKPVCPVTGWTYTNESW